MLQKAFKHPGLLAEVGRTVHTLGEALVKAAAAPPATPEAQTAEELRRRKRTLRQEKERDLLRKMARQVGADEGLAPVDSELDKAISRASEIDTITQPKMSCTVQLGRWKCYILKLGRM